MNRWTVISKVPTSLMKDLSHVQWPKFDLGASLLHCTDSSSHVDYCRMTRRTPLFEIFELRLRRGRPTTGKTPLPSVRSCRLWAGGAQSGLVEFQAPLCRLEHSNRSAGKTMNAAMKQIFECCGIAAQEWWAIQQCYQGTPMVAGSVASRRGGDLSNTKTWSSVPSVVVYCFSFGASSAPSNLRQATPANQRL